VAGCTSAPALEDVLVLKQSRAGGFAEADPNHRIAEVDHDARLAVERARARPEHGASQLAAARALALAADLRLLLGQLERIAEMERSIDELIDLQDALPQALRSDILALVSAGLDHADRAAKALPSDVEARFLGAFHLSLVAWAEGIGTAVLRGRGPKLAGRLRALAEMAEGSEASFRDPSGPWRLRGRFLDRAPWPYGDSTEGIRLLQVAIERGPAPIDFMFLGDALWSAGQEAEAEAAWRRGVAAAGYSSYDVESSARRALIEARLNAIDRVKGD